MMDKKQKKEYLNVLENNELYKEALSKVSSEQERQKIKAMTNDTFLKIIEAFFSVKNCYEQNPAKMVEIIKDQISKNSG